MMKEPFDSWKEQDIFLSSKISKPGLGPTCPSINGYWGLFTQRENGQGMKLIVHLP
jgi:hypothetical protein